MSESGQNFEQKYHNLLTEFNQYREKILLEKQAQLRDFERSKAHLDKTYKQMEKKYETKLQEQRIHNQKREQKLQATFRSKEEDLNTIIQNKNKFIEELKRRLMESEREKHEIIEQNTQMLYDLSEGIQVSEKALGPNKSSYQQLARLYQFVLEENNSLKKQLYRIGLKNFRQETEGKDESKISIHKITMPPRDEKKKKKTSHNSTQNSKINYQSTKTKNVGSAKKEQKKN